jgi:hypothetical protein
MTYSGLPQGAAPTISRSTDTRVLDYAVSVMPSNKIFLGFQIYARDGPCPSNPGTSRDPSARRRPWRGRQVGAETRYRLPRRNRPSSRITTRGAEARVWFEDARSVKPSRRGQGLRPGRDQLLGAGYPSRRYWVLLKDIILYKKWRRTIPLPGERLTFPPFARIPRSGRRSAEPARSAALLGTRAVSGCCRLKAGDNPRRAGRPPCVGVQAGIG